MVSLQRRFVLLSLLAFLPHSISLTQDKKEPFLDEKKESEFDAFAEVEKATAREKAQGTPRITLLTEFIQLNQREWTGMTRDEALTDDSALRQAVEESMESGHAELLDMNLITTKNESPFLGESFQFHIYPSTVSPPVIDEKNDRVVPVSFASSECWQSGFTASGEATLSRNFAQITLNIAPEYVGQSGTTRLGSGNGAVEIPKFTVQKVYSDLAVTPGDFALAGVFQAHSADQSDRGDNVVAVFVRATLLITDPTTSHEQ